VNWHHRYPCCALVSCVPDAMRTCDSLVHDMRRGRRSVSARPPSARPRHRPRRCLHRRSGSARCCAVRHLSAVVRPGHAPAHTDDDGVMTGCGQFGLIGHFLSTATFCPLPIHLTRWARLAGSETAAAAASRCVASACTRRGGRFALHCSAVACVQHLTPRAGARALGRADGRARRAVIDATWPPHVCVRRGAACLGTPRRSASWSAASWRRCCRTAPPTAPSRPWAGPVPVPSHASPGSSVSLEERCLADASPARTPQTWSLG
jgi:hypothetical protein